MIFVMTFHFNYCYVHDFFTDSNVFYDWTEETQFVYFAYNNLKLDDILYLNTLKDETMSKIVL